jgi:hypothetical protein
MAESHCCIALHWRWRARIVSYPPRHDIRAALQCDAMQSVVLAQVLAFLFRLSTCTPGTVYSTDGLGANEHRLLLVPIRETRTMPPACAPRPAPAPIRSCRTIRAFARLAPSRKAP